MDDNRCKECKHNLTVYVARVAEALTLADKVRDEQFASNSYFVALNYLKLALEECSKLTKGAATFCVIGGVGFIMPACRCAEALLAAA